MLLKWDTLKENKIEPDVKVGGLVVIKGNKQNKAQWKRGTITEIYSGKDGNVRVFRLSAGKLYLDQALTTRLVPVRVII